MTNPTIGIDIGGTRIKAALVNESGRIVERMIEPSSVGGDYPTMLSHLETIVHHLSAESEYPVTAVGLSVAGLIDKSRRRVLTAPNCPALCDSPLADDLSRIIELPIAMDNDANMMALGEGTYGATKGCGHFIAMTIGTGIGGAVVSEGRIIRGINGGGGELGHIPISSGGPLCGCGAYGCLEAYIGRSGIRRYITDHIPRYESLHLPEISKLADAGQVDAIKVFEYIGRTLAICLAGLVNIFNPEVIVIGGGVALAGDVLFEPL
ncbi:MAG: ROK family protein, partial [Candidatus Electryoneaceae bacterium]|nr:ROK family protein [Candidatus Electryoneaceae bacterium]